MSINDDIQKLSLSELFGEDTDGNDDQSMTYSLSTKMYKHAWSDRLIVQLALIDNEGGSNLSLHVFQGKDDDRRSFNVPLRGAGHCKSIKDIDR